MSREEILATASKIQSWSNKAERSYLYELASAAISERGAAADVGVWKGQSAFIVGNICKYRNANLYAIDVFTDENDLVGIGKGKGEVPISNGMNIFEQAKANLMFLPVLFIKGSTLEGAKQIPNGVLDFCFIDADHSYETVKADILAYLPKMKKGGLLCGDDWENGGVAQAVKEVIGEVDVQHSIWKHAV